MRTRILNDVGYIAVFLAAVSSLTFCQDKKEMIDSMGAQISLSPEVATKGAVVTTANMSEFVVFGYSHGHNDWADVSTTATSNLMFNNKYTKTGNSWVGETKTQWPDNEFKRYSFFAYSPVGSVANKLSVSTNSSTPGYQKLSYETLTDVTKQVDLVLASRLNQTPAKEVPLSFSHALARIGFCAYAESSGVTIKSISINGVKYKGQIEVRGDADWSNVPADKANFTATINSGQLSTDVNNPTMLTGSNGENYFMLLPQDLTGNTDNTTCITVVTTKDGKDRSLSYTITHNYQKGKSLLYKVFLNSGVDLVVDYTVTDWTINNIPTDVKATYLNVTSVSEVTPATFFYATDYTGAVTVAEVGTTGMLTIVHDPVKKSFTVNRITGVAYKIQVVAGNLSRTVDILIPVSVSPNSQSSIPYGATSYTVNLNSLYAWSASTNVKGVTITPSSGAAGTDVPVVIAVDLNVNHTLRSIPVTFTAINGTLTKTATWTGSQIANPDYYAGRFAGTIVTQTIDASTTRYYYSKRLFLAATDESGTYKWAESNSFTGAASVIDGKSNTGLLASAIYPAAYICYSKSGGNWYLPAQDQISTFWIAKSAMGTFTGSVYWGSNEGFEAYSSCITINSGSMMFGNKPILNAVRCVREE